MRGMSGLVTVSWTKGKTYPMSRMRCAGLLLSPLVLHSLAFAQVPRDGVLSLGGFRCIDLRPYRNDNYLDLYQTGFWSYASFRLDVWKRMGVPYWYHQGA